ncbi:MAG: PHP-associated domain-containing protein [Acidimicrobiia bacterium]
MSTPAEHPHLSEPLPAGWVRVDLHSHTMWSGDSTTTPDELLTAVESCGIDVLCITDHNAIAGAERLAAELPCRVIVGEEMKTSAGELIGLFMTERLPFGLPPHEAAARIRAQGAITYVPHPFDPMRHAMRTDAILALAADGLLDAVEAFNAKTSLRSLNDKAADLAAQLQLPSGAGSDAHVPGALGAAYVEMPDFDGPTDFLAKLAEARIVGHHWDKARPWTARIIPSISH